MPLNLSLIIKHYNIGLIKYSKSNENLTGDGFSVKVNNKQIIYYNDIDYPIHRQRFTIAHELGHCLIGHLSNNEQTFRNNNELDNYTDIKEIQANVFARDILMPATVLHSLNVTSSEVISKLCNVSKQSAEIRLNRLLELNKRNMFNKHPLERQIFNQFTSYITNYKKL